MSIATVLLYLVAATDPMATPADPRAAADALVADGVALGEARRFDEAIERFEAADRLFPRAMHVCNIGLAHARADRPEKAHFYLLRCQARATEALPGWVDRRLAEARRTLEKGAFAPVELIGPPAALRVSHYGSEVLTPPITVWLPLGSHRLSADADGFLPWTHDLIVQTRAPIRQAFVLQPRPAPDPVVDPVPDPLPDPVPDPLPDPILDPTNPTPSPRPGSSLDVPGLVLTVTGGVALVAGLVLYPIALDSRDDASALASGDLDAYNDARSTFELERGFAYGLTFGGAALTTVGVVLLLTGDDTPAVGVSPLQGGGFAYTTLRF